MLSSQTAQLINFSKSRLSTSQRLKFPTCRILKFSSCQIIKFSKFQTFEISKFQLFNMSRFHFSTFQIYKLKHAMVQNSSSQSFGVPKFQKVRSAPFPQFQKCVIRRVTKNLFLKSIGNSLVFSAVLLHKKGSQSLGIYKCPQTSENAIN